MYDFAAIKANPVLLFIQLQQVLSMRNATITGWGKCLPPATLTNQDLSTFLDTNDEWIQTRTGMQERRISHVNTSELAYVAAAQALAAAGLEAEELDGIFFATCTADCTLPSAASKVQAKLGAKNAAVFDMNAACTGFIYGLTTANSFIKSGQMNKVLVIGAERISYFLDWTERGTAVLFGDGAGAVIIEATDAESGVLSAKIGCDGDAGHILSVPNFGTDRARFEHIDGLFDFNFEGQEIFKRAVTRMGHASNIALEQANMSSDDINFIIPHQANLRIIEFLAKRMGASKEQVMVNVHKYGNTSSATVPIALCEALEEGRINPGDNILLAAFGGGLTWGATVLKWGERVTPIAKSDVALPEYNGSALELIANAIKGCQDAKAAREANAE